MRGAFAKVLTELAAQDERIMLLTGDLGFMALEPFADQFPDRFVNVGVAEQNMVGVATGLAEAGFIPFVYSIVTFATLRPYEFIRNGPVLHRLPVRIVGIGGGVEYGHAGVTHHGVEDVGVWRIHSGMTIVAPADGAQTRTAIEQTWNLPQPIYYRLGKNDRVVVPEIEGRFTLGQLQVIGEGRDLLLVTMGAITAEVVSAAKQLTEQGIACTVAVVSSFNPSPDEAIRALLARFPLAISVEVHSVVGGVGSWLAEIIAGDALPCRLERCGIQHTLQGHAGSQSHLEKTHQLSAAQLVATARRMLTQEM